MDKDTKTPEPFLEYWAHGDGHTHECVGCGGGIEENAPLYDVALVPDELAGYWHVSCWDDRP